MTYAKGTDVPVSRSQEEITKIFLRYKVESYGFQTSPGFAAVQFIADGVPVQIGVPLPERPTTDKIYNPDTGRWVQSLPRWEQEVKESWRALVLLLKANLEAVDRGLLSIEQAFMAYIMLDSGQTMGEAMLPRWRQNQLELTR